MTLHHKKCPVCGTLFTSRAIHCSESCKMKAKRQKQQTDTHQYLRHTPLVQFILRNAIRSGTIAILQGVDLQALSELVNSSKHLCWQYSSAVHISHYVSAKDRGSISPANLGLWPAQLNQQQGSVSLLNIGHRVSDRDWHNSSFFVNTPDEAWKKLIKYHGRELLKISGLRKPKRLDQFLSLQRRGCKYSFSHIAKLSEQDFSTLLIKHGLKPKLPVEVPENERVTKRQLLIRELKRQISLYPHLRAQHTSVLAKSIEHYDEIAEEALSLAIVHKHNEALTMLRNTEKRSQNQSPKAWRDTEGKFHPVINPTHAEVAEIYKFLDAPDSEQQRQIAKFWNAKPGCTYDIKLRKVIRTSSTYSFF
ncbi:DUF2116 family Zn-ribbon domain-containing protein [Pantoea sp. C8B4]|uniref:hypothetical protein n=1 Tax=Pantoea sp. C8B4 TaxID=3243083 RepID=UPI003ED9D598